MVRGPLVLGLCVPARSITISDRAAKDLSVELTVGGIAETPPFPDLEALAREIGDAPAKAQEGDLGQCDARATPVGFASQSGPQITSPSNC